MKISTTAYYRQKGKLIKKSFWGDEYDYKMVKVKILGTKYVSGSSTSWSEMLIQLPNKKQIVVQDYQLFINKTK